MTWQTQFPITWERATLSGIGADELAKLAALTGAQKAVGQSLYDTLFATAAAFERTGAKSVNSESAEHRQWTQAVTRLGAQLLAIEALLPVEPSASPLSVSNPLDTFLQALVGDPLPGSFVPPDVRAAAVTLKNFLRVRPASAATKPARTIAELIRDILQRGADKLPPATIAVVRALASQNPPEPRYFVAEYYRTVAGKPAGELEKAFIEALSALSLFLGTVQSDG